MTQPSCKSLLFVLAMDVYEKYKVIEEECSNLITSLTSFVKDIDFENKKILSGQKQSPIPHIPQKQKEYFYALRAVYNIRETAKENINDFKSFYKKKYDTLLKREEGNFVLFDFISKRDCMTNLARDLMHQLKNYQLKLIQQREQSPPVLPLPDIFRRFNISAYSFFISDYARMIRYQIYDFIKVNIKKEENDFKDKIRDSFKYHSITNIWEHSSTSKFYNMFVNLKDTENKEGIKNRNFTAIKNTYWFLEFPIYLPLIVHEISHFPVDILIKEGKKNVFSNFIKLGKLSLIPIINLYEPSPPYQVEDHAKSICTEILVDIVSFYMLGASYIFALFLQIVGIGNHLLFKRLSISKTIKKCSVKDQDYDVPEAIGVPWKLRINVLIFLYDKVVRKGFDNNNVNNCLVDEIKIFLNQYKKSGEEKYSGFENLYNKFSGFLLFEKKATELLEDVLKKTFLKEKIKPHYYYKTNLSEECYEKLKEMLKKSRGAHCNDCKGCNGINNDDIEESIDPLSCLKLEDIAWETTFSLAKLLNDKCNNFKEIFFDEQIKRYPSGKRSFFLAFTSYNFRNQFFLPTTFLKNNQKYVEEDTKLNELFHNKYYKKLKFNPQKHFSKEKLNNMLETMRKDFNLSEENKYHSIDFEIEKEILDSIIKFKTGMNLCVLSFCRKDLREETLNPNQYIEHFLKQDKKDQVTAGILFGHYNFFVLQEKYYPNSDTLVWKRNETKLYNKFPFHTKSKLVIEVKLTEENQDCKSQPENSTADEGNKANHKSKPKEDLNVIVRCRCESRGQHFILLKEIKNRRLITQNDRFFISAGWEDLVIFLCGKKDFKDIANFIKTMRGDWVY